LIRIDQWLSRRVGISCLRLRQLGDAEVQHLDAVFTMQGVTLAEHHDVVGLNTSMDDPFCVSCSKGTRNLQRNVQRPTRLHLRRFEIGS
jgi:hypothetical protein